MPESWQILLKSGQFSKRARKKALVVGSLSVSLSVPGKIKEKIMLRVVEKHLKEMQSLVTANMDS